MTDLQMNGVKFTEGDDRVSVGEEVDFIVVDSMTLYPQRGIVCELFSEYVKQGQLRIVGADIGLTTYSTSVPWKTIEDLPSYYYPRGSSYIPVTNISRVYIPIRHIIKRAENCLSNSDDERDSRNWAFLMDRFNKHSPYGSLVLYNEPKGAEKMSPEQIHHLFVDQGQRCELLTRKIVGQVLDFGVDYDGVLKLALWIHSKSPATIQTQTPPQKPPSLDTNLIHGAFSDLSLIKNGSGNSGESKIYKLPCEWIHGMYDVLTLGPQTYQNVLKHLICDTLTRHRVRLVLRKSDNHTQKTQSNSSSYWGVTEDGIEFFSENRRALNTDIPLSYYTGCGQIVDADGYERKTNLNEAAGWLNLRDSRPDEHIHQILKPGYVIYGRLINSEDKLEWCTPPHGFDLLRVYLITNGNSQIFKTLNSNEIYEKLKYPNGTDTIASILFRGLINPTFEHVAISYLKREFIY